ncbi:MAG: endonuclease/exonuclease/phosphatase family protein [Chlorobi bacterium]|nr:endonuclease/exonuclease/phosphatase family protein [Chlorobiota bacterium]
MKKVLRFLLYLIGIIVLAFILLLLLGTLLDYRPPEIITVYESENPDTLTNQHALSFLGWNIGYAGLGSDMDFFYDGGKQVRTSRQRTLENINAISNFLESNDTMDFMLLQEVDFNSKRTYHVNELDEFKEVLPDYHSFSALNYKVFFVPLPFNNPMGKVRSGLVMFSKYNPSLVERRDFPGQYGWPTRLFMLDRCFLVAYFPLGNNRQLLMIDTHNSAFDDGSLKKEEMTYLKKFILQEHEKGNLVIVDGDWNQNPPGYNDKKFNKASGYENFILKNISTDYMPAYWTWSYDPYHTTNRSLVKPYNPETTATTVLDFSLLSPGIQKDTVFVKDLGFKNSDHQPVLTRVLLNEP